MAVAPGEPKQGVARDMRLEDWALEALGVLTCIGAAVAEAVATTAVVEAMDTPAEEGLPTPVAAALPTHRATAAAMAM